MFLNNYEINGQNKPLQFKLLKTNGKLLMIMLWVESLLVTLKSKIID